VTKRLLSVLFFALVVSAGASYIIYRVVSSQIAENAKAKGTPVVVAARDLHTGDLISASDVKLVAWTGPIPPGAFTKTDDVTGRGVIEPVYENEAVIQSRVAAKGAGAGLAATIPPGMRAVAVRVNDVVGVAGFVTPGMHVDILISGTPPNERNRQGTLAKTLLQNIEVLSAGQNIQKDAEGKPITVNVVNLLVTPEQAETLSLAGAETRIQLVLRNPTDKAEAKTTGTSVAKLFTGEQPAAPKTTVRRRVARKPEPVAAPKPVAPPPPPPPITVEVIQGSKRAEFKFKNEAKQGGLKNETEAVKQ
jgi:pilus assembly protein CpaB